MSDPRDAFVIHRLRSKPVEYSITIRHYIAAGDWQMSVTVEGAADDNENRCRVAEASISPHRGSAEKSSDHNFVS